MNRWHPVSRGLCDAHPPRPPSRFPWFRPTRAAGAFLTAAKAFDVLERVDPDNADDYAAGVLGAAAGVFQAALASHAGAVGAGAAAGDALDALHEVLELLRDPAKAKTF